MKASVSASTRLLSSAASGRSEAKIQSRGAAGRRSKGIRGIATQFIVEHAHGAFHNRIRSLVPRVVVVGAGAAGTLAAIFAASAGAETLLLESTKDGGRKILISGGGRCNILPSRLDENRFVTDSSPATLRNIVRSWPLAEQRAFFEQELGLALVEEAESGKLFPASNKARDVRDGLLALAARA